MKKSSGWVIFGVAAATIAAGAYYVYRHQDRFFKSEEVITPDGPIQKRNYLALDMEGAKSQINESFNKTKEAAQETIKKVGNKFKGEKNGDGEEPIIVEEVIIVEEMDEPEKTAPAEPKAEPVKEKAPEVKAAEKKAEKTEKVEKVEKTEKADKADKKEDKEKKEKKEEKAEKTEQADAPKNKDGKKKKS